MRTAVLPTVVASDGLGGSAWPNWYTGAIDNVVIWRRILTSTEVARIYSKGLLGSDAITPVPELEPDSDSDGLRDNIERNLGTNAFDRDSDRDGISDFDEVNRDGNPQDYQSGVDLDPNNSDTDGDGAYDGEEINFGSDPLRPGFDGICAGYGQARHVGALLSHRSCGVGRLPLPRRGAR